MPISNKIKLSDTIRIARRLKNVTQTQLAMLSGIDREKINRFENEKIDIPTSDLIAILKVLNIQLLIGE